MDHAMETPLIQLIAILTARADREAALSDALAAIVQEVRAEPGCLRYDLYVDAADKRRMIMLEAWKTEEALGVHVESPPFRALAARFEELLDRPLEIIRLEPVAAT